MGITENCSPNFSPKLVNMKYIKKSGITDVAGHCLECGEKWEGGQTALTAIRHHEATGHHIRVNQTIWWERLSAPATSQNQPVCQAAPKIKSGIKKGR